MFYKRSFWMEESGESPFWKVLQFIGLPKHLVVSSFDDLRWICKSLVLQRWYMRSLQPVFRHSLQASNSVHSYGFRSGFSTSDIIRLMPGLLSPPRRMKYANAWRQRPPPRRCRALSKHILALQCMMPNTHKSNPIAISTVSPKG